MTSKFTRLSEESKPPSRVLVMTSPKAGSGVGREQLPELMRLLKASGIEASTTDQVSELRAFTDQAQASPDEGHLVVAAGGDGTLTLVADQVNPAMPLVPLPLGTENLLARHFGYTASAAEIVETICHGQPYWLDAGRANGRLFLVMATCGFDAEVVRGLHLTRKGHIRRLSYAGPISRALRRYRFPIIHVQTGRSVETEPLSEAHPFRNEPLSSDESLSSDEPGCEFDGRWAMVFNLPRYGGGLEIHRHAIGNDGKLDVLVFQQGSLWSGLRYLAGIKTRRHFGFQDVDRCQATTIRITSSERVPYQLDGDYVGRLPLVIEMLAGRVQLRLPAHRRWEHAT